MFNYFLFKEKILKIFSINLHFIEFVSIHLFFFYKYFTKIFVFIIFKKNFFMKQIFPKILSIEKKKKNKNMFLQEYFKRLYNHYNLFKGNFSF